MTLATVPLFARFVTSQCARPPAFFKELAIFCAVTIEVRDSPTRVFSVMDVEFGRTLSAFIHPNPGLHSDSEAAHIVRSPGTRRDNE